jgi:altronate dehydratase large subunit
MSGTLVLCETPEFLGAEYVLARRAATPEIGKEILKFLADRKSAGSKEHG